MDKDQSISHADLLITAVILISFFLDLVMLLLGLSLMAFLGAEKVTIIFFVLQISDRSEKEWRRQVKVFNQ